MSAKQRNPGNYSVCLSILIPERHLTSSNTAAFLSFPHFWGWMMHPALPVNSSWKWNRFLRQPVSFWNVSDIRACRRSAFWRCSQSALNLPASVQSPSQGCWPYSDQRRPFGQGHGFPVGDDQPRVQSRSRARIRRPTGVIWNEAYVAIDTFQTSTGTRSCAHVLHEGVEVADPGAVKLDPALMIPSSIAVGATSAAKIAPDAVFPRFRKAAP